MWCSGCACCWRTDTFNSSMSFMLVRGRPLHCISFLSLDIISIAMRTFRASYTLRRMFFSSYCCCNTLYKYKLCYSEYFIPKTRTRCTLYASALASVENDKPGLEMKYHSQDQKIQPQVHLRPALEFNFCNLDNTSENRC